MSLRLKVLLILCSILIVFVGIEYIVLKKVVYPRFVELEDSEAKKDIQRCVQAIEGNIHHMDSLCHDWSSWDDTYEFILDRNKGYIKSNLAADTFVSNGSNMICLFNTKGELVWGEIRDPKSGGLIELSGFSLPEFSKNHPYLFLGQKGSHSVDTAARGIIMTGHGPMMVCSRQILTTNNEGPSRGWVIMGKFLDQEAVDSLVEQTHVKFCFWSLKNRGLIPDEGNKSFEKITPENPIHIENCSNDFLHVYTVFSDISGGSGILLMADVARDITKKGRATTQIASLSAVSMGVIILAALLVSLQLIVLMPITRLKKHVIKIGKSNDLSERVEVQSKDEIGRLGLEFNSMAEKLAAARTRLIEQSYKSGIAEMAAGILHNIRNILNPMSGQIAAIWDKLSNAPLANIERAAEELNGEGLDVHREQSLVRYIRLGSVNLTKLIREAAEQIQKLKNHISQIEEILSHQDRLSRAERAIESLRLTEIMREAVNLMPQNLQSAALIEVNPDIAQLPAILGERIVLIQVFSNLLNNAAESIIRFGGNPGKISIDARLEDSVNKKFIRTEIRDNGEGFDQSSMTRLFERNFSKKGLESSGIGLHWCANVVSAMGGEISAQSDGIGKGAGVHLRMPVAMEYDLEPGKETTNDRDR
ncbi:putative Integral membrane sensor signal transduction histidine kinase [uncultured Desulfobacterium sp.]|uniref:histidine kinase n=1 Tax=uncultured Desulfobacterium sp. TaxID=201089 RepID=A0A445MZR3_9BACT|nr:putative Integral membrane sensor signal transduction histidine kinase [uncultured Desulfobacterium sp.]